MKKAQIAIIGMACRLPGANTPQEFWQNLVSGTNSIREIPPERWENSQYYAAEVDGGETTTSKWCGLIDDIDQFDPRFFGITPREAKSMDPQQRLLLQETWHCIEDAAVTLEQLQSCTTSVHVGVMGNDYLIENAQAKTSTDSFAALGQYDCLLANRISWVFGFTGGSYSVNAACAASLVALHQAKVALQTGESAYAFVAGVNLNINPWKYVAFSKSRMLSPDGQCKAFDKDANGYVPGDGIGVLLLQPLADALRDGNHIYGMLDGSAIGHVGHTASITAPDATAQAKVIAAAYADAGLSTGRTTYVEAHGTGTSLGDPIEIEGLRQAFRKEPHLSICKIGSVKSNIGHLEAAAGIAGVIKVLLMLQYRQVPPSLNISVINPVINLEGSPFQIATTLSDWVSDGQNARQAGVSAFGFGGVNAHVLLTEYPENASANNCPKSKEQVSAGLFVLSAKSAPALKALHAAWQKFSQSERFKNLFLTDINFTLLAGRNSLPFRYGFYIKNTADLVAKLADALEEPSFKQEKLPHWLLLITPSQWVSLASFNAFAQNNDLVAKNLNNTIAYLSIEQQKELQSDKWSTQNIALYQLVLDYSYLISIIESGWQPTCISYTGSKYQAYLTYLLSHRLSLQDAIALHNDNKKRLEIRLKPPTLPFFNPVDNNIINQLFFEPAYFNELLDTLKISQDEIDCLQTYANALKASQFTFKKYLDEWENLLQQKSYPSLDGLFFENNSIARQKQCAALIVQHASIQLDRKWNLQRNSFVDDAVFQEWLDLLNENILTKGQFIDLFLSQTFDIANLVDTLNKNNYDHILSQALPLLKSNSLQQVVTGDIDSQIVEISAMDWKKYPLAVDSAVYSGLKPENNLVLPIVGLIADKKACFEQTLLKLWLKGVNINWLRHYPEGSFCKVNNLPAYVFDTQSFWLSRNISTKTLKPIKSTEGESPLYHLPVWQCIDIPNSHVRPLTANIMVFSNRSALVQDLLVRCDTPIVVEKGSEFKVVSTTNYYINSGKIEDYKKLLADNISVQRIYFFWGCAIDQTINTVEELRQQQEQMVLPLFRLCKAAAELNQQAFELVVVTQNLYVITHQETLQYPVAALPGIAKVFVRENPQYSVRCKY
jgi:acyl transferase domain-containing protein